MQQQNLFQKILSSSFQFLSFNQIDRTSTIYSSQQKKITIDQYRNKQNKTKSNAFPNFFKLLTDRQVNIDNIIKSDIIKQGKTYKKLNLNENQTCFYASQIYQKQSEHWKNRQITQLTTHNFGTIPIQSITKIKLLHQQPLIGYNQLRVTINQKKGKDFAISSTQITNWFTTTILVCLTSAGYQPNMQRKPDQQVQGYIIKKSQFLGNWQLRYISISPKQKLSSSKKKGLPPTIQLRQLTQLWTRLQTMYFNGINYLVIKAWYMRVKYQFGVPVMEAGRWTRAFTGLVK